MHAIPLAIDERKRKLGGKIKRLREAQGLSQRRFALMVGVSPTYLWVVEAGRSNVGFSMLCRIADGLDISVSELLDFSD